MYFKEIGSEKKIHGVKVVPAQKPCVVNVLPSLQFEREENPCSLSRVKRNKIGIERSEDMTN